MNVIERNFFRLLRAGAFTNEEPIEPMSPWKWRRLYQIAVMLNVARQIGGGVEACQQEYFVSIMPTDMKEKWAKAKSAPVQDKMVNTDDEEEGDNVTSLTNPLLDRKLQAIMDAESDSSETPTRLMLLNIVLNTRNILNEGIALPLLIELGQMTRNTASPIDYDKLGGWIKDLRLQPMVDLLGTLLVLLLGFKQEEIHFMKKMLTKPAQQLTADMFRMSKEASDEWLVTQSSDQIFARSTNSRAMFWHVGHSARYSRLYPSEALTNFFKSFAHSLSHIEE